MKQRPVSIRQVAEEANVSTATVSNVFSGKKPVRPELAEHVRQVADRLGYQLNRAASNLRSGESRIVTVLVPDLSDPFFTSLVTEVEAIAQADGYDIIVANAKNDIETERSRVAALLSWQSAGMVIVPCTDTMPEQLEAAKANFPIVVADRGAKSVGYDTVRVDSVDAGMIAANHLLDLGHRNILLAASDMNLQAIRDRCNGASQRIEAMGGCAPVVEIGSNTIHGAEVLSNWLMHNTQPTAIISVTDMTTLAALTSLAERKCEVGRDISLVGFDDYPWMVARRTPITAVRQPVEEIADGIWASLRARMNDKSREVKETVLRCSIKLRGSTVPPTAERIGSNTMGPDP